MRRTLARPFGLILLGLIAAVLAVGCGDDDETAAADLERYCALSEELDRAGAGAFRELERDPDATPEDFEAAEREFVESHEAQGEAIRAWAGERGHEVVGVCADNGRSGALDATERPALLEALNRIEAGDAEALVTHRLDRLARALHVQEAVLARVWARGGQVWEVVGDRQALSDDPTDPMRTFVRQVMGAAQQLERGLTVARMQGGRRRPAADSGYIAGWVPYGWERRGGGRSAVLVEVPAEQVALKRMARLRKRGRSLRQIADRLNADGVLAKGGGAWGHTSVRAVLLRAA